MHVPNLHIGLCRVSLAPFRVDFIHQLGHLLEDAERNDIIVEQVAACAEHVLQLEVTLLVQLRVELLFSMFEELSMKKKRKKEVAEASQMNGECMSVVVLMFVYQKWKEKGAGIQIYIHS